MVSCFRYDFVFYSVANFDLKLKKTLEVALNNIHQPN